MVTDGCSVLGGGFASHAFRGLLAVGCWLLAAGCCPCLFVCLKVSVFEKMRVGSGQTCMWDRSMAAVGMPESFTNVEFVYMCVCVCVRACAQSKMRTYTHASTHTHMHIHVHMRAHVHTCEHSCEHQAHTHMRAHVRMHTYTHASTYIHTCEHMHIMHTLHSVGW